MPRPPSSGRWRSATVRRGCSATAGPPAISPKGDAIAYVARNEIVLARLDGAAGRPEALVRERGRDGSLVWSPDGARLAFVSARGDHTLVGVYDLSRKSLTWLSPGVDQDVSPVWSPNGQRVAFIRVPTGGPGPFSSVRTGQPWSIWIADAVDGKGARALDGGRRRGESVSWRGREQRVQLGRRRPHRVPVGAHRVAAPLQRRRRGRHADAVDAGRLRGVQRGAERRRAPGGVLVEPERHRPSPHLDRAAAGGSAGADGNGRRDPGSTCVCERRPFRSIPARRRATADASGGRSHAPSRGRTTRPTSRRRPFRRVFRRRSWWCRSRWSSAHPTDRWSTASSLFRRMRSAPRGIRRCCSSTAARTGRWCSAGT